jgi:hypothetical protein
MFGVITVKINMDRIRSKVKTLRRGFRLAPMAYKEPTATNADTTWSIGLMAASGIYVPNKNTDKGNRR